MIILVFIWDKRSPLTRELLIETRPSIALFSEIKFDLYLPLHTGKLWMSICSLYRASKDPFGSYLSHLVVGRWNPCEDPSLP